MKQWELVLTRKDPDDDFKFKSVDKIQGDTLMEILQQFMFVLVRCSQLVHQEEIAKLKEEWIKDDDIPF